MSAVRIYCFVAGALCLVSGVVGLYNLIKHDRSVQDVEDILADQAEAPKPVSA